MEDIENIQCGDHKKHSFSSINWKTVSARKKGDLGMKHFTDVNMLL